MIRVLVYISLVFLSSGVLACKVVDWSVEEWINNSESVYLGTVISISAVNNPDLDNEHVPSRFRYAYSNSEIELHVIETLKGDRVEKLKQEFSWCGGGKAFYLKEAVVFKIGNSWHVKSSSSEILEAKNALTSDYGSKSSF